MERSVEFAALVGVDWSDRKQERIGANPGVGGW